jgi:hypothetical protein
MPIFQNADPAVTTTPAAIATYVNASAGNYPSAFNAIDATKSSGSDMCAKISTAANALNGLTSGKGGVIDARGFTGRQTCAVSISSGWPSSFPADILLGTVEILTAVQQVIPNHVHVRGLYFIQANLGTIIRPGPGFPKNTAVIEFGDGNPSFSVQLSNAVVSCISSVNNNPVPGTIGIENMQSQEQSYIEHVTVTGCTTGVWIHNGAQNSGPYHNIDCDGGFGVDPSDSRAAV